MKVGIVGLPNAGKSSLFNALTRAGAQAANYPFTTVEPNVAVVPVPDERLDRVAAVVRAVPVVHEAIEFHDIAGLVRGAHRGEGLGNKFLGNIRETDAILHVVRAHDDAQVVHPEGRVDPLSDVDAVDTELLFADLEQAERRLERVAKQAKSLDPVAIAEEAWLREVVEALGEGRAVRTVPVPGAAAGADVRLQALTSKPVLYVANVAEGEPLEPPAALRDHATARGARAAAVSARLDSELAELEDEEAVAMRAELGVAESGLATVIREAFALLRPDLVLHGGRGEGGARARDPGRHAGPARRRLDPLGHRARLRGRRGGVVERPRGDGRVRRRARAGAQCGWRARLRHAGRRRGHVPLHAIAKGCGARPIADRAALLPPAGRNRPLSALAAIQRTGEDGLEMERRIVIAAFPDVQPLDVAGPSEVFHTAARIVPGAYEIVVAGLAAGPVAASSLTLHAECALPGVRGPVDTLVVPGGRGVREREADAAYLAALRRVAGRSRRVAGVCTGALLLAAAGLLDGRRATTHWASCGRLAEAYPRVQVDPDPIFVRDGGVFTSAGVTAGMDLALALVEEDLGPEVALDTARWLVHLRQAPRRPGPVQRPAHGPAGRPPSSARASGLDRRSPGRGPLGARAGRAGPHERAELRPRLRARGGHDARGLRGGGPGGERPHRRSRPPTCPWTRWPGGPASERWRPCAARSPASCT